MAHALSYSFTPAEIAFMCEMELITVVPRQRLDSIPLLSGPTPKLLPPHRAALPLWLALLLKRQRRADIVPPPWLHAARLAEALERETADPVNFSSAPTLPPPTHLLAPSSDSPSTITPTPPFDETSTAEHGSRIREEAIRTGASMEDEEATKGRLPYHWIELSQLLLADAESDVPDAEAIRRLLRDLREVRMAKVRRRVHELDGVNGVDLSGIGAMEMGEARGFVGGVVDGLRRLGRSREDAARERADEEGIIGGPSADGQDGDSDEDMVM